jgi:tetratricopeptide (TPR) repeat protein
MMRRIFLLTNSIFITAFAYCQLTTMPSGGNKKASVSERIGITDVAVHYDRPAVKGREGKIWGDLVHKGFIDQGFGPSKAAPWRAGANENTIIEFSTDVNIEGQPLPAGKYGFFIAYDANECTIIFSKNTSSWGSYFYDPKEDALRVKIKPMQSEYATEWLKYEFISQTATSATIALLWEKLMFPFKIEVDYIKTQLASFREELRSEKGFTWNAWNQAAQFCLQNSTHLEEGLSWAEASANEAAVGEKNFTTLSTKAQLLRKLNRNAEADAIMKEALPMGKLLEVHLYARQLIQQKKTKEAMEVFKLNYSKYPNDNTTHLGMARGYSALGNYKKALEFAQKALSLAPDAATKSNIEKLIQPLKDGKDIN